MLPVGSLCCIWNRKVSTKNHFAQVAKWVCSVSNAHLSSNSATSSPALLSRPWGPPSTELGWKAKIKAFQFVDAIELKFCCTCKQERMPGLHIDELPHNLSQADHGRSPSSPWKGLFPYFLPSCLVLYFVPLVSTPWSSWGCKALSPLEVDFPKAIAPQGWDAPEWREQPFCGKRSRSARYWNQLLRQTVQYLLILVTNIYKGIEDRRISGFLTSSS